jgi:mono/diheme cytochrome c family protein
MNPDRIGFALALLALGCSTRAAVTSGAGGARGAGGAMGTAGADAGVACGVDLPVLHAADPAAAMRGEAQFTQHALGQGLIPIEALENLWLVWGTGSFSSQDAFWAAFRERYGFYPAPFDNGPYPMGIRATDASTVTIDCLACHATVTAGRTFIGAGNSQLDLQGLFDDLVTLRALAMEAGFSVPPLPFTIQGRTGAAGANDAFGLGLYLASQIDPPPTSVHTTAGFQQAPAWWTLRYRDRMYLDGSGQSGGYRTMMATLLASGTSPATLVGDDATFADIFQYLLSLEPPCWPFGALDAASVGRGRNVFDASCASCHGVHSGPSASFPERVVEPASIGTDAVRAESFDANDVAWIDGTWVGGFGAAPFAMKATGGYLAPPLAGVWATAPYFHNGSVPDLAGVLDSKQRPARWKRTGSGEADYDTTRVGWRYTTVDSSPGTATIDARKTYDTTQPGLGNGGHTFGDALSDGDRADLLEYLRSL